MTLHLPDNSIRCGREEFVIGGSWPIKDLTWRYDAAFSAGNNPPQTPSTIEGWIAEVLDRWAEVTDLRFSKAASGGRGEVDLLYQWVRDDNGDDSPLDSASDALAHAWLPQEFHDYLHEGDTHMNGYYDYETWIDARTVLLHETGHALGLSHSNAHESVMYPAYRGLRRELYPDDVSGIQALYGLPPAPPPNKPLPLLAWPIPGFQNIGSGFDADRAWGLHAAVDIPTSRQVNIPCVASFDGIVKRSFFDSAGGNIIEIEDANGWLIRYVHMNASAVPAGEIVERGQQVGLSGNTGTATTGSHLHYAVWHRKKAQALRVQPDPYAYRSSDYWAVDPRRLLEEDEMAGFTEEDRKLLEKVNHNVGAVLSDTTKFRQQLLPGMAQGSFIRIDHPGGERHGQVWLLLFAHAQGTVDTRRVVGDSREWDIYGGVSAQNISWAEWLSIEAAFEKADPLPPLMNQ